MRNRRNVSYDKGQELEINQTEQNEIYEGAIKQSNFAELNSTRRTSIMSQSNLYTFIGLLI